MSRGQILGITRANISLKAESPDPDRQRAKFAESGTPKVQSPSPDRKAKNISSSQNFARCTAEYYHRKTFEKRSADASKAQGTLVQTTSGHRA